MVSFFFISCYTINYIEKTWLPCGIKKQDINVVQLKFDWDMIHSKKDLNQQVLTALISNVIIK